MLKIPYKNKNKYFQQEINRIRQILMDNIDNLLENKSALKTSRNFLQKSIILNESLVNQGTSLKNKTSRKDLISARKNVRFGGRNSDSKYHDMNINLGSIHREQMQLREIQNTNDLIESRIKDEENLLDYYEKFPYDKENIDIKQDVLQRYRRAGDYNQQSRVLEKFRKQAQQLKRRKKFTRQQTKLKKFQTQLRHYDDSEKRRKELEALRKKMQKQLDEQRRLRELQEQKMKKISSTLNGLASQLQNNAFTLQKGIRELYKKLNNKQKQIRLPKKTLPYPDTLDLELSSRKIPIIVYNDQPFDARLYFSDIYKQAYKIQKNSSYELQTSNRESKKITDVLQQNNRRLEYLEKLTQRESGY